MPQAITCNGNLIENKTGSNYFLKNDINYNFIRLKVSEFYLVKKNVNNENEPFYVTIPVISSKPLHVTEI